VVCDAAAGVTAGVEIVSRVVSAALVVALDEDPLEEDPLDVPLPLACVIEPVGTVNGGLPLVSAVVPPPPPHEATATAIATASSPARP
jgi:hypothetical protein